MRIGRKLKNGMSSRHDTTSPTDTACSSESPAMLGQSHLLYDQHSSEEELEVINGPSSIAAAEEAAAAANLLILQRSTTSAASESSSVEPEEIFEDASLPSTPKRASSTILENRKRSLAPSSDDEVRSLLEPVPAPVNFRTSPPLEALKPNRSHKFRATTPLILSETSRGIESIRISCDNSTSSSSLLLASSSNCINIISETNSNNGSSISNNNLNNNINNILGTNNTGISTLLSPSSSSPLLANNIISPILNSQKHPHTSATMHNLQYNNHINCTKSISLSSASSSALSSMDVRSVSPPAKLFHCAMSPRRRPPRNHHAPQRLQRPHRPCLDFDKMQQLKARSVTSWRHNNEHTGELSVFCW